MFIFSLALRGLDVLGRFFYNLNILETLSNFVFDCFAHQSPYEKGSALKGKNLLQRGANFFLSA